MQPDGDLASAPTPLVATTATTAVTNTTNTLIMLVLSVSEPRILKQTSEGASLKIDPAEADIPFVHEESRSHTANRPAKRSAADIAMLVFSGLTVAVLLVFTVILVNREDAFRTADDARIAILAEGTLSAAAAEENASNQVLLAKTLTDSDGKSDSDVVLATLDALDQIAAKLHRRLALFEAELTAGEQAGMADSLTAIDKSIDAIVVAVDSGDLDVSTAAAADHTTAYEQLVGQVVDIRDTHTYNVLLTSQSFGRVKDVVQFLIFFLVPFIMIIAYRRGARRRENARRLEEALEIQRALTQSRDDFIADLSHELRTPLTGIYGFALALQEISELNDEEHELVSMIVGESVELNRMVDDLLVVGRIVAGTLVLENVEIPLGPVISDTVAPFTARGISIDTDITEVSVRADPNALRHLLVNLVSNAVRHGGDSIVVSAIPSGDQAVIRIITFRMM